MFARLSLSVAALMSTRHRRRMLARLMLVRRKGRASHRLAALRLPLSRWAMLLAVCVYRVVERLRRVKGTVEYRKPEQPAEDMPRKSLDALHGMKAYGCFGGLQSTPPELPSGELLLEPRALIGEKRVQHHAKAGLLVALCFEVVAFYE